MLRRSTYLLRLVFILVLASYVNAELARLRQDGGRIVTSSTLKWVPGGIGGIPEHAIPISESDVSTVWCRAEQHGTFAGGSLHGGICTAPFLGQVLKVSEGYEVLVSINGSARVIAFTWDKYKAPPENAVASSEKQKQYLAFRFGEDGVPQAGYLVPPERRVHIVDGEVVQRSEQALVLAEDEPGSYELKAIALDRKRKSVTVDEEVKKETTLENDGTAQQRIAEAIDITTKHLVYWGQVKGTLIGKRARIVTPKPEEEEQDITWGSRNVFDRVYSQLLEYDLPPGSATDVKVIGTVRKTESPYVGTLTAIYSDGTRLSRVIEGLHIDERLLMLQAIYSPPYYLHNKTELGIEERIHVLYQSTTTTTTTTTTTSTTTTVPEPPWVSMVRPGKPQPENLNNPAGREVRDQNVVAGNDSAPIKVQNFSHLPFIFLMVIFLV